MDPSSISQRLHPGQINLLLAAAGICATVAATATAQDMSRQTLDFNGAWQAQKVEDLDTPPASDAWKPFHVPGTFVGHNYERAFPCQPPCAASESRSGSTA